MRNLFSTLALIAVLILTSSNNAFAAKKPKVPTLKGTFTGLLSFIGTSCSTLPNALGITFGMQITPAGNKAIVNGGALIGLATAKRNKKNGELSGKVEGFVALGVTRRDKFEIKPSKSAKTGKMKVSYIFTDTFTGATCFDTYKGSIEKQ